MPGPRRQPILLLLLAAPIVGCHPAASRSTLHAAWVGLDTGAVEGAARAVWCPEERRLELTAMENDAGVGFVLYPASTLEPGEYPAFDPGADTVRRPGAAAAVRRFTDAAVRGYQGDSGSLLLRREGKALAGKFGFRLRSLEGTDTLRLTGDFTGSVPGSCPADSTRSTDSTN